MCYETKCSKCGKTSWGGCGRHVRSVYEKVPAGHHCLCRDWPGVNTTTTTNTTSTTTTSSEPPKSSCSIM